MEFTGVWENLTRKMGYWVNMDDPYITYDNKYIETLWWLLKQLFDKGLLYKGYTIQPYSPAAGTGLSTHELNQPGCYRDVKDTTCTAQFRVIRDARSEKLFEGVEGDLYFLRLDHNAVDAAVEHRAGRGPRDRIRAASNAAIPIPTGRRRSSWPRSCWVPTSPKRWRAPTKSRTRCGKAPNWKASATSSCSRG